VTYLYCAVAAAVGLGGALALRRYFFWGGGLLIGGLAALAYAGALGGSGLAFKMYYALGASMLPGWIGVGSLQAVFSRRLVRWPAIFVIMLSAAQLGLTIPAGVNADALARLGGGNGAGVLVPGSWVLPTVLFNTFGLGFAAVAAFFAWWRAFRVQAGDTAARAVGLSLVVIGILCRSDAVYRLMVDAGIGAAFLLADTAAFGLIWAGARVSERLPGGLERALGLGGRGASVGVPSP
jgi:hypothetical protein